MHVLKDIFLFTTNYVQFLKEMKSFKFYRLFQENW